MARKYNPNSIDESKIIKKEDTTIQPQPEVVPGPTPQPEPEMIEEIKTPEPELIKQEVVVKEEKPKVEDKPKTKEKIKEVVINGVESKTQNYMDIVNQYIEENPIEEIKKEENIPVYNYSKNKEDGTVKIEPKNKKEEKIEEILKPIIKPTNSSINSNKQDIKSLMEQSQQAINKAELEIKIHLQMLNNESDTTLKKIYESKLNLFRQELIYQQKRYNALERLLSE